MFGEAQQRNVSVRPSVRSFVENVVASLTGVTGDGSGRVFFRQVSLLSYGSCMYGYTLWWYYISTSF